MDKKTTKLHPLFYKRVSDLVESLQIMEMLMPDVDSMKTFHHHAEELFNYVNEVIYLFDRGIKADAEKFVKEILKDSDGTDRKESK